MFCFFIIYLFYSTESQLIFFFYQEISSFCFLFCFLLKLWSGMVLFLFIKIGLVPFHFWLIKIVFEIKWPSLILFLRIIKIFPIWIVFQFGRLISPLIIRGLCLLSSFLLLFCFFLKIIIILSSSINTYWILFFLTKRILFGVLFMLIYFYMLWMFIYSFIEKTKKEVIFRSLFFLILMGLPPYPIFLIKWVFLMKLNVLNQMYLYLFIHILILDIFVYFRFFINIIEGQYKYLKLSTKDIRGVVFRRSLILFLI